MAASKAITIVLIAAMFALAWGQEPSVSEPSAAAVPPGSDCATKLMNLTDCQSYLTTGSDATELDEDCCQELAGLLESSPVCWCFLFIKDKIASYWNSINESRALELPSGCNLTTPSVSSCSGPPGEPPSPGNKAWNHGVLVSALASLMALVVALQFPIFRFFEI